MIAELLEPDYPGKTAIIFIKNYRVTNALFVKVTKIV